MLLSILIGVHVRTTKQFSLKRKVYAKMKAFSPSLLAPLRKWVCVCVSLGVLLAPWTLPGRARSLVRDVRTHSFSWTGRGWCSVSWFLEKCLEMCEWIEILLLGCFFVKN